MDAGALRHGDDVLAGPARRRDRRGAVGPDRPHAARWLVPAWRRLPSLRPDAAPHVVDVARRAVVDAARRSRPWATFDVVGATHPGRRIGWARRRLAHVADPAGDVGRRHPLADPASRGTSVGAPDQGRRRDDRGVHRGRGPARGRGPRARRGHAICGRGHVDRPVRHRDGHGTRSAGRSRVGFGRPGEGDWMAAGSSLPHRISCSASRPRRGHGVRPSPILAAFAPGGSDPAIRLSGRAFQGGLACRSWLLRTRSSTSSGG